MPFLAGFGLQRPHASHDEIHIENARPPIRPSLTNPNPSRREDTAHKSPMDHLKRHSFSGLTGKHDKKSSDKKGPASPKVLPTIPTNKLHCIIESPPCVFYGSSGSSTGALLSGRLRVHVVDPKLELQSLDLRLTAEIVARKPVAKECPDCSTKTTELKKWTFIKNTKTFDHGDNDLPFSHLFPGHLPATTHGKLATLEYFLTAEGRTATGEKLTLRHPLILSRALRPGNDKQSLRIFPPTNLTAHVTLNPVIHTIGDFDISMRISGITTFNDNGTHNRWRLRKMNWRIHEEERMISPACAKHAQKVGGEGKGILHEEIRVIGMQELSEGWKTDFQEGNIYVDFSAHPSTTAHAICDVESPTGLSVKHHLVIELVVAEEFASNKRVNSATPTGAARVLRMQFLLHMTNRAGMGISWDEEQPPMYEDVPASPPSYPIRSDLLDYDGPPLDDPPPIDQEFYHPDAAESSRIAGMRGITAEDLNILSDDTIPEEVNEDEDDDEVQVGQAD